MKNVIIALLFIIGSWKTAAQEKYFTVTYHLDDKYRMGRLEYLKGDHIELEFKGMSQKKLKEYLHQYVVEHSQFWLKSETENQLIFRDFSTICSQEQCIGALIATSVITTEVLDGKIKFWLNYTIYSNIFNSQLIINANDDVASVDDKPFDFYRFSQVLHKSKEHDWSLAYPDCVFDPDGKIINPINKQFIENHFDAFPNAITQFIQAKKK